MVNVTVKWNKQVFPVDLDPQESVETFKAQLSTLTNVPVDRQKLMAKGGWKGILKDEPDFSSCTITEGLQIMLMGSAEVLAKPKVQVRDVLQCHCYSFCKQHEHLFVRAVH